MCEVAHTLPIKLTPILCGDCDNEPLLSVFGYGRNADHMGQKCAHRMWTDPNLPIAVTLPWMLDQIEAERADVKLSAAELGASANTPRSPVGCSVKRCRLSPGESRVGL